MTEERETWEGGLADEIRFWRHFLTGSPDREAYLNSRFAKKRWVQQWILDGLPESCVDDDPLRLLEVGSGPASILGHMHWQKQVDLVLVDPLADEYNKLLDELGLDPPVRVRKMTGEELTGHFPADTFHHSCANNCLDHAIDPLKCILNMISVTKPGCVVHLRHKRNEAVTQDKFGLHQWNFEIREGELVLWSDSFVQSIDQALAGLAKGTHVAQGIWIDSRFLVLPAPN